MPVRVPMHEKSSMGKLFADAVDRAAPARPRHHDLMRLSILAGRANAGLEAMRPDLVQLLLRVQTDLFAGAPRGGRGSSDAFEALALALIPRAEADTVRHLTRRLADIAHTPQSVSCALAARGRELGISGFDQSEASNDIPAANASASSVPDQAATSNSAEVDPIGEASAEFDLALAQDDHAMLGGRLLQDMVARARRNPALARALLVRTDLPALSLAPLYLKADRERRADLRAGMARDGGGRMHMRLVRPTRERIAGLHDAAQAGDKAAFGVRLAQGLGLAAVPDWRFDHTARHDCLALALLALGVPEEDCIRIFLTLDKALACDVKAVFGLVEIIRRTPRSVACAITEALYEITIALPQRHAATDTGTAIAQAVPAGRGLAASSREDLWAGARVHVGARAHDAATRRGGLISEAAGFLSGTRRDGS